MDVCSVPAPVVRSTPVREYPTVIRLVLKSALRNSVHAVGHVDERFGFRLVPAPDSIQVGRSRNTERRCRGLAGNRNARRSPVVLADKLSAAIARGAANMR